MQQQVGIGQDIIHSNPLYISKPRSVISAKGAIQAL